MMLTSFLTFEGRKDGVAELSQPLLLPSSRSSSMRRIATGVLEVSLEESKVPRCRGIVPRRKDLDGTKCGDYCEPLADHGQLTSAHAQFCTCSPVTGFGPMSWSAAS